MRDRRGLWIGGAVLLAAGIFWGVGQAVGPSGGDVEFHKMLEAMQRVKTFRGSYSTSGSSTQFAKLWEVDCNRAIVHQHSQDSQAGSDSAFGLNEDEFLVGDQRFIRSSDGAWENTGYAGDRGSAKWYCDNIARGTVRDLLPDVRTLISHGITEKGDKKTVNGVRCREWKFDIRTAISSQVGSVCIGVDDHLPYEMTMDGGHYSYSDFNSPIQFDAPDAVLQPASAAAGTN